MKRGLKKVLLITIAIVLVVAIYFTFFFYYSCGNLACFRGHQETCSKTKFLKEGEDSVWAYRIKGEEKGKCEIEVKLLQVNEGSTPKEKLIGKEMTCLLPLGNLDFPESDLSKCHGLLKEELQDLIIQKLHSYVIENVGEITEELQRAI